MIILDTNVVSEPMKQKPDPNVLRWLDDQISSSLYLTTVSLAELLSGVEIMPDGRRKNATRDVLDHLIGTLFEDRILSFNDVAAKTYARISAVAKSNGLAIAFADGQIAAIAQSRNFTVATRDSSPFEAAGVKLINPWLEIK